MHATMGVVPMLPDGLDIGTIQVLAHLLNKSTAAKYIAQLQNKLYNCKKNAQWQFSFALISVCNSHVSVYSAYVDAIFI
jgi:hypothetical protein